jgi:hypothetical protein
MAQGTLTLKQTFQMLSGTLGSAAIKDAKMTGDQIKFTAGTTTYTGHVNGNTIQGTNPAGWSATKQ